MINNTYILSVELNDYPNLFNRRIHIPIDFNLFEIIIAILSSLRITDYEDFYIEMDKKYQYYELDFNYNKQDFIIHYGKCDWTFLVSFIGIDITNDVAYLVSDGVGYGIVGMNKDRFYLMLEDSIDHSDDTKNPIMDDEDFEFYDLDIDSLNENAKEDYFNIYQIYRNKVDKIKTAL